MVYVSHTLLKSAIPLHRMSPTFAVVAAAAAACPLHCPAPSCLIQQHIVSILQRGWRSMKIFILLNSYINLSYLQIQLTLKRVLGQSIKQKHKIVYRSVKIIN